MQRFPLILKFREIISGPGFVAGIRGSARLLMVEEEGKWWIYGVNPGSLADSGNTPELAYNNFRESFNDVFQDMAIESNSYGNFAEEVSRFILATDSEEEKSWLDARKAIQQGQTVPDPLKALERIKEEAKPFVESVLLSQPMVHEVLSTTAVPIPPVPVQQPSPQDNRTYQEALAA